MNRLALCLASVLITAQEALAQDFSGTWKLDASRSRVNAAAGLAALIGAGAPETLHITQAANGSVTVESQMNESHARIYVPGRKSSSPITVGPAGSITVMTKRDGRRFVSEGAREVTSGPSFVVTQVREVFAVSADNGTLTIEVTTEGPESKSESTLLYTRTRDVGPCQSWPTPCKYPSR